MERLLVHRETPFTDFRIEDCDGEPRAVFDKLPAELSSLLSDLLCPNKEFIGNLYLDALRVAHKEVPWTSYENDFLKVTFKPRSAIVESKALNEITSKRVRVKLTRSDAGYLLLKWKFECIRWEALQWNAGRKRVTTD